MAQYWLKREDQAAGPFSGQQLKQMAAAGMILTSDMISADQINWKVAGQVEGMFPLEQPVEDRATDSPRPSVPYGAGRTTPDSVQNIHPRKNHGMQSAKSVLPTGGPRTKTESRQASPIVSDSIPQKTSDSVFRRVCLCLLCWFLAIVVVVVIVMSPFYSTTPAHHPMEPRGVPTHYPQVSEEGLLGLLLFLGLVAAIYLNAIGSHHCWKAVKLLLHYSRGTAGWSSTLLLTPCMLFIPAILPLVVLCALQAGIDTVVWVTLVLWGLSACAWRHFHQYTDVEACQRRAARANRARRALADEITAINTQSGHKNTPSCSARVAPISSPMPTPTGTATKQINEGVSWQAQVCSCGGRGCDTCKGKKYLIVEFRSEACRRHMKSEKVARSKKAVMKPLKLGVYGVLAAISGAILAFLAKLVCLKHAAVFGVLMMPGYLMTVVSICWIFVPLIWWGVDATSSIPAERHHVPDSPRAKQLQRSYPCRR